MTNTLLTTDLILNEALYHLENELVISKLCNRDYEQQFGKPMRVGDTIRIRRPVRGTVRTGATMQTQDITEGRTALAVATQIGADIEVSSVDLTLKLPEFGERILRPQMIKIANQIDSDVYSELYKHCPNWVGTPGQTINSFADYALGPQRLDELAVPTNDRAGILSPADYWGTVGSVTALSADAPVRDALRRSSLGRYANTDTYMSQIVKAHTVGSWGTSPTVDQNTNFTTYAACKDTDYLSMTFLVDDLTNSTGTINAGDVFTIAGVYAVNPITGDTQDFLRQFVVITGATADSGGNASITISPAIITSGPYKTCSAAPADGDAITVKGSVSTSYRQNLVMHPDAVTLAVVPLVQPEGAVKVSQKSYKGLTMRLIQGYDMTNDLSQWRFDVLYGTKAIQPHLATRISGT